MVSGFLIRRTPSTSEHLKCEDVISKPEVVVRNTMQRDKLEIVKLPAVFNEPTKNRCSSAEETRNPKLETPNGNV